MSASQKLQARNAPSPAGQTVVGLVAVVAQHESVDEQALLDLLDRATHARVVRREKSDDGNHERARVEQLRAVRLDERAELLSNPFSQTSS